MKPFYGRYITGTLRKQDMKNRTCAFAQFYNLFERATHAMKTISAVRSGKKDNKDICLLFFFGQQ